MPLQNRVTPFGELLAVPARGTFFGNRGGRFHTDAKTLTARRWASRQWICCVLDFKGRQRDVWGRFYTELFFLDEPTALAAGHRPCFECRRKDAEAFAEYWRAAHRLRRRPYAFTMDEVLHREREVLSLLARGMSNREIGTELFITPKTASVHVSNILGKLGAASRTEAAAIAYREGV